MTSRAHILLALSAAAAASGCKVADHSPAVATFPSCPVPVLLSRVNRVGQTAPATVRETGAYDHFVARVIWEKTSQAHHESEYAYTEKNLDTGEEHDIYNSYLVVNRSERTEASSQLTDQVHRIAPSSADVNASDVMVDDVQATADQTVITGSSQGATGKLRALVDVRAHKVWVK